MSKKTIIINLIGGPGCGKSMLMCMLFIKLKELGYSVEIASEYAKTLVWKKDFDTLNNQHWVTSQQYNILKSMCGCVDFIVLDSSLFSGLYYNVTNIDNTSNVPKTQDLILKCYNDFKNINIFLKRGDHKYETEGRIQTADEAMEVEHKLLELLNEYDLPYRTYVSQTNFTDIQDIINYILQQTFLLSK